MRTRLVGPPLGGLAAFSLLLACGEAPSRGDGWDLDERVFLLESSVGFEPVAGSRVRLSFTDGELGISGGCNGQGGPYQLEDGRLVLQGLVSTLRACALELSAQDEWLREFFNERPTLTLAGTMLTLRGEAATLVFVDREVADPDVPLAGAPWTLDSQIVGNLLTTQGRATLEFSSEGDLAIDSACHTGSGRYAISGERLTFIDLTYEEKPCSTPLADHVLRAVLRDGNANFKIEADRLTIERNGQGVSGRRR